MGGSGNWIKSLITLKKSHSNNNNNNEGGGKGRKWKLWRSASGGLTKSGKGARFMGDPEDSESSFVSDGALAAAMATLVRAPHRDFLMVKQEWAAIRIQTFFRACLARSALRALRAVVRIQAIFRGRQVRKQAAVTLRCMQALVRVQARVRSQCGQTHIEGQAMGAADPIKHAEKGWCPSRGTVEELRSKIQMKQEGALRREIAKAYAYSQLQSRTNVSSYSRTNKRVIPNMVNGDGSFNWLEQWMPNKPWESRLMEDGGSSCSSAMTSISKKSENHSVKNRRNSISRKILTKESSQSGQLTCTLSDHSSEYPYDDRATTDSSISTCETLGSSNTLEEGLSVRPSYMKLTESIKAKNKQKASNLSLQRQSIVNNLQRHTRPNSPSRGSTRRSVDTNLYSIHTSEDFPV